MGGFGRRRLGGLLSAALAFGTTVGIVGLDPSSASAAGVTGSVIANGPSVTFNSSGGQAAAYTFTGTAGEVVTAQASAGTFASNCDVEMQIVDPNSNVVGSVSCAGQAVAGSSSDFIGETTLALSGTYTLVVSPQNSDPGSLTLNLYSNPANSTIVANGPSLTFTSIGGQGRDYTFTGTAGEVVTAQASSGNFTSDCDVFMRLLDVNGNRIGANIPCIGQAQGVEEGSPYFVGETTLPASGTYTLDVVPQSGDAGSVTLNLYSNPANSTIVANGASVTFTSTGGHGIDYTFSGTAGEVVDAQASAGTFATDCDIFMGLLDTSGRLIADSTSTSAAPCIGTASVTGSESDFYTTFPTTLAATGTYTLDLIPEDGDPGTVTLNLYSIPPATPIVANGPSVTFTSSGNQETDYIF
ncbi:MAG: hypothetical protein ACRDYC_10065, partial [Acidimicrobiales bacterium]